MKRLTKEYEEQLRNHLEFLAYSERDIKLIITSLTEGLNLNNFEEDKNDFKLWRQDKNHFFYEFKFSEKINNG